MGNNIGDATWVSFEYGGAAKSMKCYFHCYGLINVSAVEILRMR